MESDHQTLNQRQVRFSRFPVKGICAFSLDVFNLSFCDNFPHHPVCLRLVYAGAWGGWRQATQSQGRRSVPKDGYCDHIGWLSFGDHIGWLSFGRNTFPCNDYL